jgi:hypothetical protein
MAADEDETEEPQGEGQIDGTPKSKGRRQSFGKVRRELTEDELGSSGVQKMMLDELDRMDGAETELKSISQKYYDTQSSLAVAKEKLKTHHAFDVLSTGTVAVGSLIFGAAFSTGQNDKLFWTLVVISGVLVVVGIAAKVLRS